MKLDASGCYYHPGRRAVAVCSKCGVGVCKECAVKNGHTILCYQCADEMLWQEHQEYRKELKEAGGRFIHGTEFIIPGIIGFLIVIAGNGALIYDGNMGHLMHDANILLVLLARFLFSYFLFSIPFSFVIINDLFIPQYYNLEKVAINLILSLFVGWIVFVIPDTVTEINYGAFMCCSSLTSVKIPNGVTEIKGNYNNEWSRSEGVFSMCTSLVDIAIPNSVTKIGYGAFSDCSNLTKIHIPTSVNEIDKYAFASCTSLTSIDIPEGVTSIKWETFAYCTGLADVGIPGSIIDIEEDAFRKCTNLSEETREKILVINPNYIF